MFFSFSISNLNPSSISGGLAFRALHSKPKTPLVSFALNLGKYVGNFMQNPARVFRSQSRQVKAMEFIDEIEVTRRGPYSGGFGGISFSGDMDIALALMTIVFPTGVRPGTIYSYKDANKRRDWVAHLQAGASIVADSNPGDEQRECEDKTAALARAIDLAESSFVADSDPGDEQRECEEKAKTFARAIDLVESSFDADSDPGFKSFSFGGGGLGWGGLVSKPGTVDVEKFIDIERYSHVMHISSTKSQDEGHIVVDIFGGMSVSRDMDIALALRTIIFPTGLHYGKKQQREWVAHLQAGAGIVADSDPDDEQLECGSKVKALECAIDLIEVKIDGCIENVLLTGGDHRVYAVTVVKSGSSEKGIMDWILLRMVKEEEEQVLLETDPS
ncbi:hypothetical protein C3L33_00597, partial [Rhododendron williamsianum]